MEVLIDSSEDERGLPREVLKFYPSDEFTRSEESDKLVRNQRTEDPLRPTPQEAEKRCRRYGEWVFPRYLY